MLQNRVVILAVSTVALGLIVGASSALLSLFLELTEKVFLGFVETAARPAATGTSALQRFLSVTIGGVIVAVSWYWLRNKRRQTVGITKALSGEKMPFLETVLHVLLQIFYVGTGGSVGRELAPREAGALFAQQWEKLLAKLKLSALTESDGQLLVAAAAGAGFAGVYIAPLTGMLFAVEILLKKFSVKNVVVSLVMSVIAMFVGATVKGFGAYYLVGDVKISAAFLLFIVIVAPICGIIGAIFRKTFQWAERNQTHDRKILWQLPLMAGLTGLIAAVFPQIMGNGRALAQLAMSASSLKLLGLLLFLGLAKAVVTVFTIRAGAAGGTLTPAIAIGAVVGAATGLIAAPLTGLSVAACAIVGACAVLAASQQAPLMALFMMVEVSHLSVLMLLPLGLAAALSAVSARWLLKKSS